MKSNRIFFLLFLLPLILPAQTATLFPYFSSSTNGRSISDYWGVNGVNITNQGLGWSNVNLQNSISNLFPSTLRFPGGTNANWWDWQKGGYIDGTKINNTSCYGLPQNYGTINPQNDNTLNNFKLSTDKALAKPIFVLNMLSSTLPDQIAMLEEAQLQGFPLNEIELGNELYGDLCENIERYPDGASYAAEAAQWTQAIKQRFGNTIQIGWTAANYGPSSSTRRSQWNSELINIISGLPTNQKPDAFIIHEYKNAKLGETNPTHCSLIDYSASTNCSYKKWQKFFYNVYKEINDINANEITELNNAAIPGGSKFWFTEYNLLDRDYTIHGTWANALHTAAMTLAFLDYDKIDHINCHTLFGDALFASIFSDQNGYPYSAGNDAFCFPQPTVSNPAPVTVPFSLTGLGHALANIGSAVKNAVSAEKINFQTTSGTAPILSVCNAVTSFQGVNGWEFTDVAGNKQIIVLNLSDQTINFNTAGTLPSGATAISIPDKYQSLNFNLNDYIYSTTNSSGNLTILSKSIDISSGLYSTTVNSGTFNINTFSGSASLAPYSITRFWKTNSNSIAAVTQSSNVCIGGSVTLYSVGDPSFTGYQWYRNNVAITGANQPSLLTTINASSNDFKVVVTNASSVTFTSNTVSVTGNSVPTVTITSNRPYACGNDAAVITSSVIPASGNYYYSWLPDENITSGNPLSSSITVSPLETKNYVLYVSDGTCSSKSNTLTIARIDDFTFENVNDIICTNVANNTLTLSASNESLPVAVTPVYSWSNGETTSSILYPANNNPSTTYTVTVTYLYSGGSCSITHEKTFHRADCCNNGGLLFTYGKTSNFISDIQSASACPSCSSKFNFTNTSGNYIVQGNSNSPILNINGHLIIDEDLTLNNVKLQMGEGAVIEVKPFRKLSLNNCTLQSCGNILWEGIHVEEYGQLNVKCTNPSTLTSQINDARHAIQANDLSDININNSSLSNNYIGIYYNPASTNRSTNDIYSTTFSSTANLKQGYGWMTENVGTRGLAGVLFNNAVGTFGSSDLSSVSHLNIFDNLHCGIASNASAIDIVNAEFNNIYPDNNYAENSAGIVASAANGFSYLTCKGRTLSSYNLNSGFFNCGTGIYLDNSSANLKTNRMRGVGSGVESYGSLQNDIGIVFNDIEVYKRGIQLYNANAAQCIIVGNNKINMIPTTNNSKNIGFILEGINGPHLNSQFNIDCNNVSAGNYNGFQAYIFNRMDNVDVLNNIAHMPANISLNSNAFSFSDFNNSSVRQNGADGNVNTGKGFVFSMSNDNLVVNNSTDNLFTGFDFSNNCLVTSFVSNYMNHHNVGLHMNPTAIFGIQTDNGNQWIPYQTGGSFGSTFGAIHEGLQALIYQSVFKTIGSQATLFNPDYDVPNAAGTLWFDNSGSVPTSVLFEACSRFNPYRLANLNFIDSLVTTDRIPSVEFEQELNWITRAQLLDKLIADSTALHNNELFTAYFDSIESTSEGKLAELRGAISKIYENDSLKEVTFMANDSLIDNLLDLNSLNDSLLHSGLSISDSTSAQNLKQYYLNSINLLMKQNTDYLRGFNNVIKLKVNNILSQYYSSTGAYPVTPQNILEENEKFVNWIYLQWVGEINRKFSTPTLDSLHAVANQCPFAGGKSVYKARAILHLLKDSTEYNDEEYCHSLGYRKGNRSEPVFLIIQPNPASEETTLLFSSKLPENCVVELYEMSGKMVKQINLPVNTLRFTLNINDLSSGLYDIVCKKDGILIHKKLLIAK